MQIYLETDWPLNYIQFISIKLYKNANIAKFVYYGKTQFPGKVVIRFLTISSLVEMHFIHHLKIDKATAFE